MAASAGAGASVTEAGLYAELAASIFYLTEPAPHLEPTEAIRLHMKRDPHFPHNTLPFDIEGLKRLSRFLELPLLKNNPDYLARLMQFVARKKRAPLNIQSRWLTRIMEIIAALPPEITEPYHRIVGSFNAHQRWLNSADPVLVPTTQDELRMQGDPPAPDRPTTEAPRGHSPSRTFAFFEVPDSPRDDAADLTERDDEIDWTDRPPTHAARFEEPEV